MAWQRFVNLDLGAAVEMVALDKQARGFVTAHPIAALLCAVGIGFVAARLLSPRRTP